jgi:hypothetical protein
VKVVVDEGVPRAIVAQLSRLGIDAHRFPTAWRSLSNGKLIAAAEAAKFDCLLTNDRNMASQTSLRGCDIRVVALPTGKASILAHRMSDVADTIRRTPPGTHVHVNLDGTRVFWRDIRTLPFGVSLEPVAPFVPPR